MIKSISLQNFQKHENLTLEFTSGVNIISGPSASGKSVVRRAIAWVCFNENYANLIREGAKKASVILTLDNGIEIERIRSASVNRYCLRIPGKDEEVYDAVSKSVPEPIQEVLKFHLYECDGEKINLNISEQITLPFLFDKSPTFRMKLFNQLTGNAKVDILLKDYNRDILGLNKEIKLREENLLTQENDLKSLQEELKKVTLQNDKIEHLLGNLKTKIERWQKLSQLFDKISNCNLKATEIKEQLKSIKIPVTTTIATIKDKITRFNALKTLLNASILNADRKKQVGVELGKISSSCPDLSDLRVKIEKYGKLNKVNDNIGENQHKIVDCKDKLNVHVTFLEKTVKELADYKATIPICPTCKQVICNE